MDSIILKIDPARASEQMGQVVTLLDQGGIIGYPTETVYGLGGNADDPVVIDRIHRLKGGDREKPFLVLLGKREDITPLVGKISAYSIVLMDRFWPGPLTLIFPASPKLPASLAPKTGKVAIRVSSDPICRMLLEQFHRPLISTSANPSGSKPARSAGEILEYFGSGIDLILDGGERNSPRPSTLVDVTGSWPSFLRIGAISREEIENELGDGK